MTEHDKNNAIYPDDGLDHITDIDKETLAESDVATNPDYVDDIPSANATGRDAGNNKKLIMAAVAILGMVILFVGAALAIGNMKRNEAERKAREAEQAAQDQKTRSQSAGVDLESAKNRLKDEESLPPPAGLGELDETAAVDMPVTPIEPPVVAPDPVPRHASNDMVEGRDFVMPPPVVTDPSPPPQQIIPPTIVEHKPPPLKGSGSDVLVDVNKVRSLGNSGGGDGLVVDNQNRLANSLRPTMTTDTKASRSGNKDTMLVRGTTIPCVLKTRIDSTYSGFTVCQISKDVYSANGKILLIERGSTVFGEQNIEIKHGQASVAVLWTRIDTPNGASINIDSPATGQLGQAGVPARVHNHFWRRFGASIMLSMIQDGLAVASQRLEKNDSSGNNNTTVNNTSNSVQSMAEKALENTVNMPPTAIVHQGSVVNIMVARDVDFSILYDIKRR